MNDRIRMWPGTILATVAAAILVLSGGCTGHDDRSSAASTSQATPSAIGAALSQAVLDFVEDEDMPEQQQVRAVLVSVDGRTVLERYLTGDSSDTAEVASVTKSVVGTLVGIALADGRLSGLDAPLDLLLPDYAAQMSPEVAAITLEELLTMTAGLPEDPPGGLWDLVESTPDWVSTIVTKGITGTPGDFAYSSVSSHLLAAILDHATGTPLLTYARTALFDPLGIDTEPAFQPTVLDDPDLERAYEQARFAWPVDPQGINMGYGGLKLTARDMLTLGRLYLGEGRWEGRQIVPEQWVRDATRQHVGVDTPAFRAGGYGYQWWTFDAAGHPAYAAVGWGGQIIEVVPDLDLVFVASTVIDPQKPLNAAYLGDFVEARVIPLLE